MQGDPFQNPCQKVLLEPYMRRASDELANTRFKSMLSHEYQESILVDFALHLFACAEDTLDSMVSNVLAQENWLWGLNADLVPSADLQRVRRKVAKSIEESQAACVDEAAPLLRTVLKRQTSRFVATTKEVLDRIWQCRHQIVAELLDGGAGGELGTITDLDMRFGDCHDGGRRTAVVTCEAGRFVYKPRNSQADLWFTHVANTFFPDAMRQPRTITFHDESGHWGFAEFIERMPVADEGGISRYWHNFGRAVALFQALGSEDLHCENFVATGELVSLVDSETVITGEPRRLGDPLTSPNLSYASTGFGRDIRATLATSVLLPSVTVTGFNASPLYAKNSKCLPVWDGREYDVVGYEDEFLSGLDEGLQRLATRADELADEVRATTHMPMRRIIRDTVIYACLLRDLRRCESYDPVTREEMLEMLHRPLIRGLEETRSPLATSEIACLLEGDVPYFYAEAGSRTIFGTDGTSDSRYLAASAQERALEHIEALDQAHRSFVHDIIEANLSRALLESHEALPPCVPTSAPLDATRAIDEACDMFNRLERIVVSSPSGESSWLFRNEEFSLAKTSVGFGDGLGGVAVFLAALATRAQDPQIKERACSRLSDCLDRLEEVVACLEVARVIPEQSVSLGMSEGLGGIVRTFDLVLGALDGARGMDALVDRTRSLQRRFLAVLGRVDVGQALHTDVYAGIAGLLLALSSSPAAREFEGVAAVAKRLASKLLELRCLGDGRGEKPPLCDTLNKGWPVSGFAHGQAGVACALAQGSRAFGIDVGTAVVDALSFELNAYNERIGTWPDLRERRMSETYVHGICSGAPGMGLTAQMVWEAYPDADAPESTLARELLERADAACARIGTQDRDVLCCGNLSVVEYLLMRGRRREAGRILAGMVERKEALGTYVTQLAKWKQTDEPSFLWGLAGIGYMMLRYTDPALSCVF